MVSKSNAKLTLGFSAAFLVSALSVGPIAAAQAQRPAGQDVTLQAAVAKSLQKSRFKSVVARVNDGVVDLTGRVDVFANKVEAQGRVQHIKNVAAVRNELKVGAGETSISDEDLQNKLAKKVAYDRVGYGTTAFNAIKVKVNQGIVTLSGEAYGPADKSSAASDAAYMPGVKDVINQIQVDPLSPMDDRIRIAVFRSVYGFPSLNKYAIDPAKPIRITVQNGNVTLSGVVDSKADKDAAGIMANSVGGAFSVRNLLQEANRPTAN